MAGRIKELDGLRAVAVAMVVIGHCESVLQGRGDGQWLPLRLVGDGITGVLIFFVLSGFLITRILLKEWNETGTLSLARFYWHRAVRILPASYSYILVIAILGAVGWVQVSGAQLAAATLHMWNYAAVWGVTGPGQGEQSLGHFWSLALEEQFYWVWPLLLLFVRHRRRFLMAVILAMPIIRVVSYVTMPMLRDHLRAMFHTGIDPIATGALLACCEEQAAIWAKRLSGTIINMIIALLFVVAPLMHILLRGFWTITYGATVEGAAAAGLIIILVYKKDHWAPKVLRAPPFQYVGMISFSLYLWQQLFCIKGAPFEMEFYFSIPAAIGAASLSFYLIERPASRLRGLFPRRPAPSPLGASAGLRGDHVTVEEPVDPAGGWV